MSKYRIVCFGDSLTWGWNPADMTRFPEDVRWPGVMQSILGDNYKVIEEGQSSRTINCDDPAEGKRMVLNILFLVWRHTIHLTCSSLCSVQMTAKRNSAYVP